MQFAPSSLSHSASIISLNMWARCSLPARPSVCLVQSLGPYSLSVCCTHQLLWSSSTSSSFRSRTPLCALSSDSQANASRGEGQAGLTDVSSPFVVTTPLYYVNAPPHMGSAYPTIAADALSRFHRLQSRKVIFVTGTDEHGEKIALAAAASGRAAKEHCDLIAEEYRSLWKDLNISYDRFIRTTSSHHEKIVAEFYKKVFDKGDIYKADYEGLYCINCEEFKDDKDLVEDKYCPIHQKPCELRCENNYFFHLKNYQRKLEDLLSSKPYLVQPSFRMNEVMAWVKEGVKDFSLSRAAVEWGIPVPSDNKQTIYVWFDALLGYISALLPEESEPTLVNAVCGGWPASVHIIGKDILRFHSIYWPAMLMSAGLPLPECIYGHGFLTKDGLKMGKSLGNTIDPKELATSFGSDAVRYYFLKEIEFGRDGDYSEDRFVNIVNAHLADTIGNLLNRILGLLKKNCGSSIVCDSSCTPDDNPVKVVAGEGVKSAKHAFSSLQFSSACEAILSIAAAGNAFIDKKAPWTRFKQGGTSVDEASQDLVTVLEAVRIVAVALSPITPELCLKMYSQLGYSEKDFHSITWNDTTWGGLKAGHQIAEPKPVFLKIEGTNRKAVA